MKKKNVLLMGVHGRIGEHLYLELNESAKLFAFSSPNQEPDHENITFIKKDLFILPEVEEALKNIDVVIFFEDPIMRLNRLTQGKFYDLYLLIADNIARAAATNNVEQIIYIADELSDGSIVSILGAYGTNVKETDTPIRRYGKNLTYKTKDYNSVRSVQRAPLPPGWTVENVAWYYFGWLDEIIYDFVNTKIENNTISIYVLDKPKPVLELKFNDELSEDDIVLFEITGGSLKKRSTNKAQRFEFRKLPDRDEFIMALHDFEPSLPWLVFKMTQAPIQALVSRIYQVEMIINKDVPERRPHNNK
ncbi:NAD-dependent epimerase/dehydratase family protein [Jeotgalicoccus psychrophilus]|uniref:NAD-dependent epimerase/dehydratase family protein n=1 Tax=Jeotgalicoccus psychrophilus TaxID=157228 RepID=UPI000407A2F5|nr:NAD-dependent epimerase/dehydratase family protein [Jeotgalicoccus psychrophilus]